MRPYWSSSSSPGEWFSRGPRAPSPSLLVVSACVGGDQRQGSDQRVVGCVSHHDRYYPASCEHLHHKQSLPAHHTSTQQAGTQCSWVHSGLVLAHTLPCGCTLYCVLSKCAHCTHMSKRHITCLTSHTSSMRCCSLMVRGIPEGLRVPGGAGNVMALSTHSFVSHLHGNEFAHLNR